MILIGYDGSEDSRAAIARAAELLADRPATVLTVWEPFIEVWTRTPAGFGLAPGMVDIDEVDRVSRESARARAEEGTELARQAGLNAQPRTRVVTTTTADAILSEADELDASVIVLGTRGLTGLKSLLLGSVSHAVTQHTDRPVVVVPSPAVSAARREERHARRES